MSDKGKKNEKKREEFGMKKGPTEWFLLYSGAKQSTARASTAERKSKIWKECSVVTTLTTSFEE